jgi:asparaginyl-tRNA synthetase
MQSKTILIKNAAAHLEQLVEIKGWVYNLRSSGKLVFLQIRDGSGFIQAIVSKNDAGEEVFSKAQKLTQESSVILVGQISTHPQKNEYELQVQNLEIVQIPKEDYPITNKEHGIDFLLDQRHLWLRSRRQWAIQRVRNTIISGIYQYLHSEDFTKIDAPIFTPSACEGTTTLFEVDCFGESNYLTQSGQLYLEAAIFSLGRVFDFGPVFRAEKSKTRRHLLEFWMMDAEAAFVDHQGNMQLQEGLICHLVNKVLAENQEELLILERNQEALRKIKPPFVHLTHQEAVKKLQSLGSKITETADLGAPDETLLTKEYDRPIFVEKYPAKVKAFYMKADPDNPDYVLCADLLAPEGYGEIIGGSEREDSYEVLLSKIQEHNLPLEAFNWYLDLRKYGSVPHSGFGIGLERVVAWICGLHHVRETIPFPRMLYRMQP